MGFQQVDSIRFFSFDTLADAGVVQAVLTRRGGVSPRPWSSLNVGGTVGDDPDRVAENRRQAFAALGRSPDSLFDVWQVHSASVVTTHSPRAPRASYQKADVILTDRPEVTLFMRFADCVPVFLVDPIRRVIGLAHAGWKGTVRKATSRAVEAMMAQYGCRPADIRAAIGPSIGPDHYEVGPDVVDQVETAFGGPASRFLVDVNGSTHLDLWRANRHLLQQAGVTRIETAGLCTACHPADWYSHRGESGRTGRFGALLALGA